MSVTVNAAPEAADDTASTWENSAVAVDVLANDTDADGDTLSIEAVTQDPTDGTATIGGDAIVYTPDADFAGTDTFKYTATDGEDTSNEAAVSVTVNVNTAPVAVDDRISTRTATAVLIDVVANDTDADGQTLTLESVTQPSHGSAEVSGGLASYTPNANIRGMDTFAYTVSDGIDTDEGEVTVWVGVPEAYPNPSTTGSYTITFPVVPSPYMLQLYEDGLLIDTSQAAYGLHHVSGKPDGTYEYVLKFCDQTGTACITSPEPHLAVTVAHAEELGIVESTVPGNLPYRTGVTKGGDAYVNVPIAPVPGVNGLAPRLSIDYGGGRDRQRVDEELPGDTLGYGWRVTGLSAIRRCVKNTDDADGIDFAATDGLCLDGEPLVLVGGTHLAGGATYRTLRESFAKVLLVDDPGGDWFEAHLPDGTVREYGNTADSQLWTPAPTGRVPLLWSLNKQTDAFGNTMTYSYHEDNGAFVRHPRSIHYGQSNDARVLFHYAHRDDLDPVGVGGHEQAQWLRLHRVELWQGTGKVREYRLQSAAEGWHRLTKLQMCGYSPTGAQACLEPLEFDWTDLEEDAGEDGEDDEDEEEESRYKTRIEEVTDPLGAVTTFTYGTLTEDGDHDFLLDADDMPFGGVTEPADVRSPAAEDGDIKPVVTEVSRSDGIGGTRTTGYAYLGEDADDGDDANHGRGFESTRNWGLLGFYGIRETDGASGIVTYTQYRLDYPHFGRPAAVVRYTKKHDETGTEKLSERSVRHAEKSVSHAGAANTTTLRYAAAVTNRIIEGGTVLGAVQTSETPTVSGGLATGTVRTTRTANGAPTATGGGTFWGDTPALTFADADVQRTATATLTFENRATLTHANRTSGGQWLLGFVSASETKHYAGTAAGTADRTRNLDRTAYGATLAVDTATWFESDAALESSVDYGYDGHGNATSASTSAAGVAGSRTWTASGITAGRYPTSWTNPETHVERATYAVGHGLATSSTDATGRKTNYGHDGLGRVTTAEREWDGVTTTTSYSWCASCAAVTAPSTGCGSSRSATPVMKAVTTAPDMPTETAYLDLFGRPSAPGWRGSTAPSAGWTCSTTNAAGRSARASRTTPGTRRSTRATGTTTATG